jgi:nitroreductase
VEPEEVESEHQLDEAMNVFECIATRRSIRKFMSSEVPMELIGTIIDAARFAPSTGNIQDWRFIIIRDKGTIGKIAEAAMQQLWIAQAPIVIVVCSDFEKLKMFYGIRGERLYSIQNCSAAIENMLLAAHGLGLGSTWVSAFDDDNLRTVLNIPGFVRPIAILPIGYPDEVVPTPMRYTIENVCFFNTYGNRIINIDKVLQNPDIFGRVSKAVNSVIDAGKDVVETYKTRFKKK